MGSQNALQILIHWICSFGKPDDDSIEPKHVAIRIILCNKLLCLTEIYDLQVLHKHTGMTNVKCWNKIVTRVRVKKYHFKELSKYFQKKMTLHPHIYNNFIQV